tara:strand:+ start:114 stop:365 length:252 start_codon:yes stop_codon:yes gene_type:complete
MTMQATAPDYTSRHWDQCISHVLALALAQAVCSSLMVLALVEAEIRTGIGNRPTRPTPWWRQRSALTECELEAKWIRQRVHVG